MKTTVVVLLVIAGVLLLLFSVFLFLVAPGKKREGMAKYKNVKYAHRGLHGDGVCENSITAFSLAVEGGYGIELDVRLSSDGELVVFHDDTLERITGKSGRVDSYTLAELKSTRLGDTDDTIPAFSEVLSLVNGKVPLLVEIKEDAMKSDVSEKTCEILSEYKGDFIVESFNPLSLGTVKKRMPGVLRGLLSQDYFRFPKYRKPLYFFLKHLLLNFTARPDFIALSHEDHGLSVFRFARKLFGVATIAWTVKSKEDEENAYNHGFDGIIFEGYRPMM